MKMANILKRRNNVVDDYLSAMYSDPLPRSLVLIKAPVLVCTNLTPSVGGGNEDRTTILSERRFTCWIKEGHKIEHGNSDSRLKLRLFHAI